MLGDGERRGRALGRRCDHEPRFAPETKAIIGVSPGFRACRASPGVRGDAQAGTNAGVSAQHGRQPRNHFSSAAIGFAGPALRTRPGLSGVSDPKRVRFVVIQRRVTLVLVDGISADSAITSADRSSSQATSSRSGNAASLPHAVRPPVLSEREEILRRTRPGQPRVQDGGPLLEVLDRLVLGAEPRPEVGEDVLGHGEPLADGMRALAAAPRPVPARTARSASAARGRVAAGLPLAPRRRDVVGNLPGGVELPLGRPQRPARHLLSPPAGGL